MIRIYRSPFILKVFVVWVIFAHLFQIAVPPTLFALTGGPSTPEASSFQAAGTANMVDLATGDFNYSIPLMDVEGYPINIGYQSGITMDQEASMVGLGWNLNVGSVSRSMRGLPDDFKGDSITKEFNIKDNVTTGMNAGVKVELFGLSKPTPLIDTLNIGLSADLGIFKNSYRGYGFEASVTPSISAGNFSKGNLTGGLSLGFNSQSGVSLQPSFSFSALLKGIDERAGSLTGSVGASYNSRAGLQALTIQGGYVGPGIKMKSGKTFNAPFNGGSSISFSQPAFTPSLNFPFRTTSFSLTSTVGGEVFGLHPDMKFKGYSSKQALMYNRDTVEAFGYLHANETVDRKKALLDFNREKDGVFRKDATTNLPLTNLTYDIFSVSGHGIGGSYRAFRGEVGTVYDSYVHNPSTSGSFGFEIGGGTGWHGGLNASANFTESSSGKWGSKNDLSDNLKFRNKGDVDALYEPYYFKQLGEKVATDENFVAAIGGENAVRPILNNDAETKAINRLVKKGGGAVNPITPYHAQRENRNQPMSFLTNSQTDFVGLDQMVMGFQPHTNSTHGVTNQNIFLDHAIESTGRQPHHIGEITVQRPDGARYIYGLPAYNWEQTEVTMNVAGRTVENDEYVNYMNNDASIDNDRGIDHYFTSTKIPAYTYAHHLTAMVYPDYVDVEGDGPTDDDLGNWVKFEYNRSHFRYPWRTPTTDQANQGYYNEGLKTLAHDDKGSYVYGEKEIWRINTVESRNFVAEFYYSPRKDGYSVVDEDGGISQSNPLSKLDSIKLFSKRERAEEGEDAEPIKVAHFEYDYDLCANIPNYRGTGTAGKLTLKKVWFTYGDSKMAQESPYEFVYHDSDEQNPDYTIKGYDRWGCYKPNDGAITNADFPYTRQEVIPATNPLSNDYERYADVYASAWHLSEIKTPSGGSVKVHYESDDYAYVQDKKAMQMFTIRGFNNTASLSGVNDELYRRIGGGLSPDYQNRNFMIIDLPESVANADEFRERYLAGIENLYVRTLIDLSGRGDWEYVSAYVQFEASGIINSNVAWLQLSAVSINDRDHQCEGDGITNRQCTNPIAKAGWNFLRLNNPQLFYGEGNQTAANQDEAQIMALIGFAQEAKAIFKGFNKALRSESYSQNCNASESWVRLNNPDGYKHGGGVRVRKIEMADNWENMVASGRAESYGQTYNYETTNAAGEEISSGVAAYEPLIGGDENAFRQPSFMHVRNLLAPDDEYYEEFPFGESFYPAPTVVYSKVTVKDIGKNTVTRQATGEVVSEFYTAKDFPTITEFTKIEPKHKKPGFILRFFNISRKEYMTASQGYVIKLNDMHGKPKAQWVYAAGQDEPISGMEYFYRTKSPYSSAVKNELDNDNVTSLDANGVETQITVGKDVEMVLDSREQDSETRGFTLRGNLDAILLFIVPIPVITLLPLPVHEHTRFRSLVATKVVHSYGILEKVVAHDLGAKVNTENIAYDALTGEVLLTKTSNEFKDPVYAFAYPAHWYYDGMSPAVKNLDAEFFGTSGPLAIGSSLFNSTLQPGDELFMLDFGLNPTKGWVLEGTTIIDEQGQQISLQGKVYVKIIRSGHRNQQSLAIGNLATKTDPLDNGWNSMQNMLNASATEFSDEWNMFCDTDVPCATTACNCTTLNGQLTTLTNMLTSLVDNGVLINKSNTPMNTIVVQGACNDKTFPFISGNPTPWEPSNYCDNVIQLDIDDPCGPNCDVSFMPDPANPTFCLNDITGIVSVTADPPANWDGCSPVYGWRAEVEVACPAACTSSISSFPYSESFENGLGVWVQSATDDIDWTRNSGGTGSSGTGPTAASDGSFYLYTEASGNGTGYPNKVANLTSPCIDMSRLTNPTITFDYMLYGSTSSMGTLSMQLSTDGVNWTTVWSRGGNYGPNWATETFNLNLQPWASSTSMQIRWNGVTGSGWSSDMAIDNIIIDGTQSPGNCVNQFIVGTNTCYPLIECSSGGGPAAASGCPTAGSIVNPFQQGVRGVWRPLRSHAYVANRTFTTGGDNLRETGVYDSFNPFWQRSGNDWIQTANADQRWTWTQEVTQHSPMGQDVENRDALDRFSSALYAHSNQLPVGVAANARLHQIGNENFEAMGSDELANCQSPHMNWFYSTGNNLIIDDQVSHTGLRSSKVTGGNSIYACTSIRTTEPCTGAPKIGLFTVDGCDCIEGFAPAPGDELVASVWARYEPAACGPPPIFDYTDLAISMKADGTVLTPESVQRGKIIEGWQQLEYIFEVPASANTSLEIHLENTGTNTSFFDDFRVHPKLSEMKTYVYNPFTLRLMAEGDERNHMTLYEYEHDGNLIRVKKETERGIMTLQENRSSMFRAN